MRLDWASNFIETPRPAASSCGVVIFEPEDRRCSDLAKLADEADSNEALLSAAMFVFITILRLLP
jgi:hypothetical protein